METEPPGGAQTGAQTGAQAGDAVPATYLSLTLEVSADQEGVRVTASDGDRRWTVRLPPAVFVARLHRLREGDLLRGSIGLANSDLWAPLQSSSALEALIRAWLSETQNMP